jgi:hypothetical protein
MPDLSQAVEAQVAALWEDALRTRPGLFNGTVFSADMVAPGHIEGHWTEYRRVLAQILNNDLFALLQVRPLAVNGLLRCADGFVLGRREPNSVYQPGLWQSPPAGSVERRSGRTGPDPVGGVDLAEQVLAECQEELGLEPGQVTVLRPVVAVEHPGSRVVDIGMLLQTPLRFAQVHAAWAKGGNREYDQLRLAALTPAGLALAPCTQAMLERVPKTPVPK